MKKIFFILSASILIFSGCSSKNEVKKTYVCEIDGANAPEWVCRGVEYKNMITGVGSAEPSPLGFNFQKTEAISAARDEIARQISVRVKNIFKRYESKVGNDHTEKVVENISKQLSYETLRNSKLLKLWKSPKGTLYVLVGMPKDQIKESIIKNASKLYNKADKKWESLDKEIDKEFSY